MPTTPEKRCAPVTPLKEASRLVARAAAFNLNPLSALSEGRAAEYQIRAEGSTEGEKLAKEPRPHSPLDWAEVPGSDEEREAAAAQDAHSRPSQQDGGSDRDVCRHWARGYCAMGSACGFPHVGPSPSAASSVVVVNGSGSELLPSKEELRKKGLFVIVKSSEQCKDYSAGKCHRGDKCKFAHVGNAVKAPVDRRVRCRDFQAGRCSRGDACKYLHDAHGGGWAEQQQPDGPAPPPQPVPCGGGFVVAPVAPAAAPRRFGLAAVSAPTRIIRRVCYTTAPVQQQPQQPQQPQQFPPVAAAPAPPPPAHAVYASPTYVPMTVAQAPDAQSSSLMSPRHQEPSVGSCPGAEVDQQLPLTPLTFPSGSAGPACSDGDAHTHPSQPQHRQDEEDVYRAQLAEAEAEAARLRWQAEAAEVRARQLRSEHEHADSSAFPQQQMEPVGYPAPMHAPCYYPPYEASHYGQQQQWPDRWGY